MELLSVLLYTHRKAPLVAKISKIAARCGSAGEQDDAENVTVKVIGNGKLDRITILTEHMNQIGFMVFIPF
jgi:putative aminopeptidase FrvX